MMAFNSASSLKILLAVDGSPHAAAAVNLLTHIKWPAATTTYVLALASAPEPVVNLRPDSQQVVADMMAGLYRQYRQVVQQMTVQAAHSLHPTPLLTETYEDQPALMILEQAQRLPADLVVMGARGLNAPTEIHLDFTANHVIHWTTCSVLIVRPTEHIRPLSTLLAVDGSPPARQALEFLGKLSPSAWARITVVSVVDGGGEQAIQAEACAHEVIKRLHDWGAQGRFNLYRGQPADEILEAAYQQQASLIVTGAHSQADTEPSGLGSVARRLAREAPCSVLIVR